MDPVTQHLISSYLLMPVLTVIFGIAAYFIARKNKLLNNKKLIVYLLLCGIVLALPGLSGFMDYNFMPYIYVLLAILFVRMGMGVEGIWWAVCITTVAKGLILLSWFIIIKKKCLSVPSTIKG